MTFCILTTYASFCWFYCTWCDILFHILTLLLSILIQPLCLLTSITCGYCLNLCFPWCGSISHGSNTLGVLLCIALKCLENGFLASTWLYTFKVEINFVKNAQASTVQITFIFIDFRVCDFAFAFKTQNAPCVSRFKRVLFSDRFQFAF